MIKRPYPAGGQLDNVRPVAGYNPEKKRRLRLITMTGKCLRIPLKETASLTTAAEDVQGGPFCPSVSLFQHKDPVKYEFRCHSFP